MQDDTKTTPGTQKPSGGGGGGGNKSQLGDPKATWQGGTPKSHPGETKATQERQNSPWGTQKPPWGVTKATGGGGGYDTEATPTCLRWSTVRGRCCSVRRICCRKGTLLEALELVSHVLSSL